MTVRIQDVKLLLDVEVLSDQGRGWEERRLKVTETALRSLLGHGALIIQDAERGIYQICLMSGEPEPGKRLIDRLREIVP